ncbi:MAG: hypothetical protein AMS26_07375 [Bacteroides sp. SM23_62]|nr:MAG: hypothetical protein AMS26_07375 [Bacteroides sp. SM23_62]
MSFHLISNGKYFEAKMQLSVIVIMFFIISPVRISGHTGPFDGKKFKGRIAYSTDGNFNDEDDWAASAFALAIFAEFGIQDKLVHFDYNCILPKTDTAWEKEHKKSILGSIELFGYADSIFHDCQQDLDGAVNSIRDAINSSTAENPLYYILAGPMEVPYRGIAKSDPEKRKYVYCISHNVWNDGYASRDLVEHNKRDVIPTGVTWIQITDQNQFLTTGPFGRPSTSLEWQPWTWLLNTNDKKLHFLWDRLVATTRADCSDAGMAYFLMTGDEQPEISKVNKLLAGHDIPKPLNPRQHIRIEAENFFALDHFEIDYKNDRRVSQRISIRSDSEGTSRISTIFKEPYTAPEAFYDVDIRYYDRPDATIQLQLYIENIPIRESFTIHGSRDAWHTFTVNDDYIQLNLKKM